MRLSFPFYLVSCSRSLAEILGLLQRVLHCFPTFATCPLQLLLRSRRKGRGRNAGKKSEEAEDEELLRDEDQIETVGHRLQAQPTVITGKMREYQMQGLNWLIHLYDNGINGILADEMVRC